MREFLRSKIHRAKVTGARVDYEGSFGIDALYLKQAQILPYESVEVYNVTNGNRIRTYAIELPEGSGRFESNGAAAHLIREGDVVIITCYIRLEDNQISSHRPRIMLLGENNEIKSSYEAKVAFKSEL